MHPCDKVYKVERLQDYSKFGIDSKAFLRTRNWLKENRIVVVWIVDRAACCIFFESSFFRFHYYFELHTSHQLLRDNEFKNSKFSSIRTVFQKERTLSIIKNETKHDHQSANEIESSKSIRMHTL